MTPEHTDMTGAARLREALERIECERDPEMVRLIAREALAAVPQAPEPVWEWRALRAELSYQWECNHAEHCGEPWPHDGRCGWPLPDVLSKRPERSASMADPSTPVPTCPCGKPGMAPCWRVGGEAGCASVADPTSVPSDQAAEAGRRTEKPVGDVQAPILRLFGYEVQLTISVGRCRVDASPAIKVTDMGKVELDMGVVSDLIAKNVCAEAPEPVYEWRVNMRGVLERRVVVAPGPWERVEEGTT